MVATDLTFPECCATCPHRNSFTASCTHDLRQVVIQEANSAEPCPVYVTERADAMRQLAESLGE
ncbi:hypothetical protein [Halobellus ordinarius]|uniref:hypothetical protein n=1 Tax=Halobellus ordinarius TaxID=3075120 RepID=UPI00288048F1|nr:hypothetical protein [Halobellus sp. ZY16]